MLWCYLDSDPRRSGVPWTSLLSCMISEHSLVLSFSFVRNISSYNYMWSYFYSVLCFYNIMQLALFTTRNVAAMEELTWVSGIHQLMHCISDTTVYFALSYPTCQCLCCFRTMALILMTMIILWSLFNVFVEVHSVVAATLKFRHDVFL